MGILDAPSIGKRAADLTYGPRQLFGNLPGPICAGRAARPTAFSALTGVTFQRVYQLYTDAASVRLVFANLAQPGSANATPEASAGPFTLKVGVIWDYNNGSGGTLVPVTFGGARSVTANQWQVLISDPIDVSYTQRTGSFFVVRSYVTQSGTNLPITNTPWGTNTGNESGWYEGYISGDFTDTAGNSWVGNTNDGSSQYGPTAVCGWGTDGKNRSVMISGDSIAAGTGYQIGSGAFGFVSYALHQAKIGAVNLAHSGETGQIVNTYGNYAHRLGLVAGGCKYAIDQYGQNDIFANARTTAQVKADLLAHWEYLARRGMTVYRTTMTPDTNSTDTWQTVSGQTSVNAGSEAVRQQINQWLRAPASAGAGNSAMFDAGGNLAGIFDTGAQVEVNANGSAITINPATGAISNGSGGFWCVDTTSYATGTTTATANNRLTDTSKSFTTNQWKDYSMVITGDAATPASVGQLRVIAVSAPTTLTTDTLFTTTPSVGATYKIVKTFVTDGIHPTTFGHQRMAAAIDTSKLA